MQQIQQLSTVSSRHPILAPFGLRGYTESDSPPGNIQCRRPTALGLDSRRWLISTPMKTGVPTTADLARELVKEHERSELSAPAILEKDMRTLKLQSPNRLAS